MDLTLLSNYSTYKICFEDKFCASHKTKVGKGEVSGCHPLWVKAHGGCCSWLLNSLSLVSTGHGCTRMSGFVPRQTTLSRFHSIPAWGGREHLGLRPMSWQVACIKNARVMCNYYIATSNAEVGKAVSSVLFCEAVIRMHHLLLPLIHDRHTAKVHVAGNGLQRGCYGCH